jgi:hypothetical protein
MAFTITEALAEIATIEKRLSKKAADMQPYVARVEMVRDPFERNGGSAKYIAEERQSFDDLQKRKVALRAAIARSNAETVLLDDTVANWLVWKRECYQSTKSMLNGLLAQVRTARSEAQKRGASIVSAGEGKPEDIVVNVDEQKLIAEIEALDELYGRLDGLLSLKNATTFIEV